MTADRAPVSPLFARSVDALRDAARRGPLADVACGRGRHALAAARLGLPTVALDRDAAFLGELARDAARDALRVAAVRCDLETGYGLPLASGRCGAVLVFRYLHRPLCADVERVLAPGGLLLYETFTVAQRALGVGPRSSEFLLEPGELPRLFPGLTLEAFDEGFAYGPDGRPTAATARLAARKPAAGRRA